MSTPRDNDVCASCGLYRVEHEPTEPDDPRLPRCPPKRFRTKTGPSIEVWMAVSMFQTFVILLTILGGLF